MQPTDVPVVLGREEAARLARDELANPAYHTSDESPLWRALQWLLDRLAELFDRVSSGPGGWPGVLALVVVLVAVVAVVRRRLGPLRGAAGSRELFAGVPAPLTAAEHRIAAGRAQESGAYADAVRERLRAVVRELEERDLLDARPGRTAQEATGAAAAVLPALTGELHDAAVRFDEIWYGAETAGPADARRFAHLDDAVLASLRDGAVVRR